MAKGRKTSADTGPVAKTAPGTPTAKPSTQARSGSQGKGQHSNDASTNTPNTASQRTGRFKSLSQKVLGVLGEHMADYHCQDTKAWGTGAAHDKGQVNSAKLNDRGQLVQLWPTLIRGRGIDAVWKSNGAKPYAIIEAKASYDPTKSLKALLGEAGDKTERSESAAEGDSNASKSGRAGKRGSSKRADPIRQANGKVTQMSHSWIERRLPQALRNAPNDLSVFRRKKRDAYTRHVLFFSIPQAVAHAEALIMHIAQQSASESMHAAHEVTRQWGDNDIEKVVDNRAGYVDVTRDARTR